MRGAKVSVVIDDLNQSQFDETYTVFYDQYIQV